MRRALLLDRRRVPPWAAPAKLSRGFTTALGVAMLRPVTRENERLRCGDAEQALHWLADGALTDDRQLNELRGHIAACPRCRASWDRLMAQKRALAVLADDDVDHDADVDVAVTAVNDAIDRDLRAEGRRAALVAAAVAVAFVVGAAVAALALR